MPRLDNSDPDVIHCFCLDNPDEPVDLCFWCWDQEFDQLDKTVDHPPYEEQNPPYECYWCSSFLTADDN